MRVCMCVSVYKQYLDETWDSASGARGFGKMYQFLNLRSRRSSPTSAFLCCCRYFVVEAVFIHEKNVCTYLHCTPRGRTPEAVGKAHLTLEIAELMNRAVLERIGGA